MTNIAVPAGAFGVRVCDVFINGGCAARYPGSKQRDVGRTRAQELFGNDQVLRQLHEESALSQARLHVSSRSR